MVALYFCICLILLISGLLIYKRSGKYNVKRSGRQLFSVGLFFLLLEIASLAILSYRTGENSYLRKTNYNYKLFEAHPYLIGVNKPNVNLKFLGVNIHHNSMGIRGAEIEDKKLFRIVCLGGSTTYGVGVNDKETWPYYLDSLLGDSVEVINLGTPGHSTNEHLYTLSSIVPHLQPDLILLHCGLNDLRNSHVKGVSDVYADFHAPTVFGSLGLCPLERLPSLASLRLLIDALQRINLYPVCLFHAANYTGEVSAAIDYPLLKRYGEQIETLSYMAEEQELSLTFIPQVLVSENFKEGNYSWWVPYLADSAIKPVMDAFNLRMIELGERSKSRVIEEVLKESWNDTDFSDPSHLNAGGNLRFAQIVAKNLNLKSHED